MATLLKAIPKFNAILSVFTEIRKITIKIHMEAQKTLNSQCNPEQKEQYCKYHNI
jgi:hypothetical protein